MPFGGEKSGIRLKNFSPPPNKLPPPTISPVKGSNAGVRSILVYGGVNSASPNLGGVSTKRNEQTSIVGSNSQPAKTRGKA